MATQENVKTEMVHPHQLLRKRLGEEIDAWCADQTLAPLMISERADLEDRIMSVFLGDEEGEE